MEFQLQPGFIHSLHTDLLKYIGNYPNLSKNDIKYICNIITNNCKNGRQILILSSRKLHLKALYDYFTSLNIAHIINSLSKVMSAELEIITLSLINAVIF